MNPSASQHPEPERHACPLCGFSFVEDEGCPAACPLAGGCGMVKCPNCRYEYVVRSRTVDAMKAIWGRFFTPKPKDAGAPGEEHR